jgi:hypothetical protein
MNDGLSASDVAVLTGGTGRNNDGMFGGDWGAWIILFLLFGLFNGNGFGGGFGRGIGGGGGGQPATTADLTAQSIVGKLDGLTNGLADSTYALNGAITGGFSSLQAQLADCCCQTQRAIDGVNYNLATQGCETRRAISDGTRDILENNNNNTRAILDFLTQDKIATLQAENQNLRLAASQANQNAVLQAAMDANTAEIIRRTGNDCPIPAYVVPNPNCCYNPFGFGFGTGYNNGCGCGA